METHLVPFAQLVKGRYLRLEKNTAFRLLVNYSGVNSENARVWQLLKNSRYTSSRELVDLLKKEENSALCRSAKKIGKQRPLQHFPESLY